MKTTVAARAFPHEARGGRPPLAGVGDLRRATG